MCSIFNYEIDLVNTFIKLKFSPSNNSITTTEVPIRWGNIDIVNIKNNSMPFSEKQFETLSRVSNSRIFLKTKINRGITKKALLSQCGMSDATIQNCIVQLQKTNLITIKNGLYYRNVDFKFPKTTITSFEAKLSDYKKALYQAMINKEYSDYSYLVFPMDVAEKIIKKHLNDLIFNDIGLIGVSTDTQKILFEPNNINKVKSYYRLANISKTNTIYSKEALINYY